MNERSPSASGLALGLVCSVGAALPAVLRVCSSVQVAPAAVALVASTSLVVIPVGLWLRRAIEAGLPRTEQALACGTALSALPLALFGGVLKSTTHHRPLGGATFAAAALVLLALCVGLSFRVLREASGSAVKSTWQNLFTLGCGLSLACSVLLGLARAARPSLLDFLALGAAVAIAGLLKIPRLLARSNLRVALACWAVLLGSAGALLWSPASSGNTVRSLTTQAPVSFAALSWLGDGS